VASDECYAELGWTASPVSLLHPDVCDGSHDGLLSVYSLSKQSNLAGYRAAFVAGDVRLVRELLEVRKHAGMIVPTPVQAAMVAALGDDEHVAVQRERYAGRRDAMWTALEADGWRVDHSAAGLYLWATRDEDCWESVRRLAARGILVAPGAFYGLAASRHVRVALTASGAAIAAAAERLSGFGR
jgi:aspartate/methionine/tyrosine aminotransferase